jgi:hypothetical protein
MSSFPSVVDDTKLLFFFSEGDEREENSVHLIDCFSYLVFMSIESDCRAHERWISSSGMITRFHPSSDMDHLKAKSDLYLMSTALKDIPAAFEQKNGREREKTEKTVALAT